MRRIIKIALRDTALLFICALLFDAVTYSICFTFTGIARSDIFNKIQGLDTIIKAPIWILVLITTLLPLTVNVTKQIGGAVFASVQQNISNNMKKYIYCQILENPINQKRIDYSKEITIRFRDDVQDVVDFFSEIYTQIPKLFMAVINLYVMVNVSKFLSGVVVIPLMIVIFIIHFTQEKLVKNKYNTRISTDNTVQYLGEIFLAIDAVKLSNKETYYLAHYRKLCELRGKYAIKDNVLKKILSIFSSNLMFLALGTILFFINSLINKGYFTIGNFILFEYYFWFMTDLPGVFSGIYTKGKQMSIIRDRMSEIVPMDVDIPETEYQEYCFKEGNKYLVVGNNGSGKSKTLKTIFASASIKPPQICYLSQAAYLISGTIKENICLGLDYDEDKMNEILEMVCLTEEFSGSLLNLNTSVGNSGEQISGGQRKRIALARVLYRDPKVLILDDMTTGLDFKTEQKVMNNLKKLSSTIIISSSNQNLEKYVDVVVDITSEHKI